MLRNSINVNGLSHCTTALLHRPFEGWQPWHVQRNEQCCQKSELVAHLLSVTAIACESMTSLHNRGHLYNLGFGDANLHRQQYTTRPAVLADAVCCLP